MILVMLVHTVACNSLHLESQSGRAMFSGSTVSSPKALVMLLLQIHSFQRLPCTVWGIFILHIGSKKAMGLFCPLALPRCAGDSLTDITIFFFHPSNRVGGLNSHQFLILKILLW